METSARNTFWGTISSVRPGAVNDEIELTMPSGTKLVASITKASTQRLGLVEGKEACALVKASMVILMNDADQYILSTRNQFCGTVKSVTPGAVNGEVVLDLGTDGEMTSIITMGSINKLGLAAGSKVTAIVKATNVIMAVKKLFRTILTVAEGRPRGTALFACPAGCRESAPAPGPRRRERILTLGRIRL